MDSYLQSNATSRTSPPAGNNGQPYVRIVEQPAKCALRFRYECEGRSAGSIPGQNSTADNKTYPTIQVCNYKGQAVVVVSCVTKDQPYRPHPHNLVGKEGCKKGVCTMVISNQDMICSFTSLGIQCVKRKDIEDSLKLRESIKVDPYRAGFSHKSQSSSIDLNVVRLCFQVFIEGPERDKFTVQLPPIVSEQIYDKKAMNELNITKLSHCSAPCDGGKEMILLCDRVTKDDIQVRFYQQHNQQLLWEAFADFGPGDVHKQVAICLRTPRYINDINQAVTVQLQLKRPSDGCCSDPRSFQILPKEVDPDGLTRKRQKVEDGYLQKFLKELQDVSGPQAGAVIVSPVSPKREVIHVPRMASIKLEPNCSTVDTHQLTTLSSVSSSQWQTSPQFIQIPQTQQFRPQMDVLLTQDYRQSSQISSQMSSQGLSQCSTASEFIIPNIPDINSTKPLSTTTLSQLMNSTVMDTNDYNEPLATMGNDISSVGLFDNSRNNSNINANNINTNSINVNNNTLADEVMEKFDSLGLEGIDTNQLLGDINLNSNTITTMLFDSGPIGNSGQNLLNSRDNVLVSSTLQTPDINPGSDDNTRNPMANPQQMQSLRSKLIQLESNNNNNVNHFQTTNDKINNN